MGKILAIVFLIVFAWFAIPRIAQAQWFAPTAYPNYWWGEPVYDYSPRVAQQGYGWFSVNFWSGRTAINAGYQSNYNNYNGGYYNNVGYYGNSYVRPIYTPPWQNNNYYGNSYNGGYYGNTGGGYYDNSGFW